MCEQERRGSVEWIRVSWNGDSWRPLVNTLLKTEFHKPTGSFGQHQSYRLLKNPRVYHLHNVSRFHIEL